MDRVEAGTVPSTVSRCSFERETVQHRKFGEFITEFSSLYQCFGVLRLYQQSDRAKNRLRSQFML